MAFFDYPKAAAFGRVLPKSKIYENSNASTKLRQSFVDQVSQIIWQYKLAPETINLDSTQSVAEIQVFKLNLRVANLDDEVLGTIDKAIPFPIFFELVHNGKHKAVAAYKRPSEADPSKWVISEYFSSEWEAENNPRQPLPSALNLGGLYEQLLNTLMPEAAEPGEPIAARVERLQLIRLKQREVERIQSRLAREKQFNKRIAINAELRTLTNELKRLRATSAP
ncbi:MAG: DUF4391 domain-containing protein [Pseudomonadales bacterium]|nr:DUF4391 domain-containing protein [Pseudomonadales bacterium]